MMTSSGHGLNLIKLLTEVAAVNETIANFVQDSTIHIHLQGDVQDIRITGILFRSM